MEVRFVSLYDSNIFSYLTLFNLRFAILAPPAKKVSITPPPTPHKKSGIKPAALLALNNAIPPIFSDGKNSFLATLTSIPDFSNIISAFI